MEWYERVAARVVVAGIAFGLLFNCRCAAYGVDDEEARAECTQSQEYHDVLEAAFLRVPDVW